MKILIFILSGLVLVLVVDLLGFLPFLAVLFFLFAAGGIGKLIETVDYKGYLRFSSNHNPVLRFCFLSVLGMQVTALVMLVCRVFSIWEAPVLGILALVGVVFGMVYLLKKRKTIFKPESWFFLHKNRALLSVLLLLFCVILVSNYMLQDDQHYYFKDSFHPVYELSIAKATDLSIPPSDLSFQGKPLKFHFASSLLTSTFYKYLAIDQLEVVYRVFPVIGIFLFIPLFVYLLILSGIRRGLLLPIATGAALFASPFALPLFGFLGVFADYPDIFLSITVTPSYVMGYLGFLALLIAIFEAIKRKRFFSFTICILSVGLLMTKASFFIPLALGVGIWSLHRCFVIRKWRVFSLPLSMFVASMPFFILFLAGAHTHNQWILAPDRLIFRGIPGWVPGADSILRFPIMFFATPLALYGLLTFVYIFGFVYVWRKRKQSTSPIVMLLVIIMLVGCTLPLFITEATEGNNRQFLYPILLLLWVLFFKWLCSVNLKSYRKWILVGVLLLALLSQQIILKPWLAPSPSYDIELARALEYIENNSEKSDVMLIGKHYEDPKFQERKYIGEWSSKPFFRTAISGRQTVIEGFKYRGIGMESDYNQRSLDNFKFYYILIDHSEESLLPWHVSLGYEPAVSKKEQRVNMSYVKSLWLGHSGNWFDIKKSFPQFLENNWNSVINSGDNEQWLVRYLDKYNVRFILFERAEKPKQELVDGLGLDLAYIKGDYSVYEVK